MQRAVWRATAGNGSQTHLCMIYFAEWASAEVKSGITLPHMSRTQFPRLLRRVAQVIVSLLATFFLKSIVVETPKTEANRPIEITFTAQRPHADPFATVDLDVIFRSPDGVEARVPAFWSGNDRWKVRYASPKVGVHCYRTVCGAKDDAGLHDCEGTLEITPSTATNLLFRHGPLRVAPDHRHFEHADGTPFLWLGDTWWKGLCKRIDLSGFEELCADRAAKGFNVVQIVCGPYPDENMLLPRWENEAGMPYTTLDFRAVNPAYFDAADRRIDMLIKHGIVPAIVGGWGRPQAGGRSTIEQVGLEGFQRHWRHLIARYGAAPVVWILGGEASDNNGPWAALADYVRTTDPYHRSLTYHAPGDPRTTIRSGNERFDFDMIAIGHDGLNVANETLRVLRGTLAQSPARPALCGEACYERHMQTNFEDVQRHLFWTLMLSGAAGHTYGAAGIWHASVEGDPGISPVYDFTTWRAGMHFPGATQLGLAKKLLEQLPWQRMEPHPDWVDASVFAAGIPGELVVVYLPKRGLYDWSGFRLHQLDPKVLYTACWFDPASGRRFELGPVTGASEWSTPSVPSPQDWVLLLRKG